MKFSHKQKVKVKEAYSSLCEKHHIATGVCRPYGIKQSYLPLGRGSISCPYPGCCYDRYSIYPPIKDKRLSRPEVNDLPRVTTEVPAIPGVSWLSRHSAPVGTVGMNASPTVVTQWLRLQQDSNPCLSNTSRTCYLLGHQRHPHAAFCPTGHSRCEPLAHSCYAVTGFSWIRTQVLQVEYILTSVVDVVG